MTKKTAETPKEEILAEVVLDDGNLSSPSGRTNVFRAIGDDGATTVIISRDGRTIERMDLPREAPIK